MAGSRDASAGGSAGARRSVSITWAIASASMNSVPGFGTTHSSALMPVNDNRGPT